MRTLTKDVPNKIGEYVNVQGYVDSVRKLGQIAFVQIRDRTGIIQTVVNDINSISGLKKHDVISLEGSIREESQSKSSGVEIALDNFKILSSPKDTYPVSMNPNTNEKIDHILNYRPVSLRNKKILDIFKVQQTIAQSFRDYLLMEGFTEIFTPKIVSQGAEGGATVFKLDYFGNTAFLAQSPQLYKQIMVASGFERVFEVGHCYRAEKHNTVRHLNEYVGLDLEMGFIDSFHDVMDLEENVLRYITNTVIEKHRSILEEYRVSMPAFDKIPRIPLDEMKDILASKYGKKFTEEVDIDPEGEKLASKYAKEIYGSDLIFLTKYPISARPFYTMPSKDEGLTESFDLLMNGLEITSGGQRIHDYDQLVDSMLRNKMDPKNFEGYLMAFKYGMPPHGGLGIGAERITARFLNLNSAREASLFPRDRGRYTP